MKRTNNIRKETEKYRKVQQGRQYTYKRGTEALSYNYCFYETAKSVTYSEHTFIDPLIQHSKHMHPIILPPMACLTIPYFPTLSNKRHDFRKKLLKIYFFYFLYNISETFLVLTFWRRIFFFKF